MPTKTEKSPVKSPNTNLSVVESASTFSSDMSKAEIVIESKNPHFPSAIEQLQGMEAKNMATAYANSRGMSDARMNGLTMSPYAVNADGKPLDEVKDAQGNQMPGTDPKMKPASYRVNVPLMRKM